MVKAVASLIDFCYLVRRNVIDEATLTQIQCTLDSFHQHREIFRDVGVRPDGFSLPRQHSLKHYVFSITQFGAPNGLCSSITESKHIKAVKRPYRRSGKNKPMGFMLVNNQRNDKISAAHTFFASRGMLNDGPSSAADLLGILSSQITHEPQANHAGSERGTQPVPSTTDTGQRVARSNRTPVDECRERDSGAEDVTEASAEIRLASTPGTHYVFFFWPLSHQDQYDICPESCID
jgi:hypothetical protein